MRESLRVAAVALLLLLTSAVAAGTAPVGFRTAELDGLYENLMAKPASELEINQQRQLALLVLMRAGQSGKPRADTLAAAKKQLASILQASGDDPEIAAIAANVRAMEAGLAKSPMTALVISKEVTRALDRLVRDNPGNGGVLMQRGSNALYAPEIAGRGSVAVTDFEELVSGDYALDDAGCYRSMELLGRAYQKVGRNDDARKMFKAIAQSSNPHRRAQGQTLLDGLAQ